MTSAKPRLMAKQARFVDEYMIDMNATQAAIRAGYSPNNADVTGPRLLGNVGVAEAIAKRREKLAAKAEITQEMIVAELAKLGFSDIRKAIRWNGVLVKEEDSPDGGETLVVRTTVSNHVTLIDSADLDDNTAAAIAQISQNATGGISLKMHDKKGALIDLGKMLGYFVEKNETKHTGDITVEIVSFADKAASK